jgi:hypothetical protein
MAGRNPPHSYVWLLVERGGHIAYHIKSYWSVDGGPLPEPQLALFGNADGIRRAASLLTRVKKGRRGKYPGPVFEYQLRQLVAAWDELKPWGLVPTTTPCLRNPPENLNEALPACDWDGWDDAVQDAGVALIESVATVVRPVRHNDIPETFDGKAIATIREMSQRLSTMLDFVHSELQWDLLSELDGVAMTQLQLMTELAIGSKETFNGKRGKGGMKELIEYGLVVNDRRKGGYYRPDAPPP